MSGTCVASEPSVKAGMGGPQNSGVGGFSLNLPSTYTSGQPFTVQLSGTSQFKGFLLYAEDSSGNRVGSFSPSLISRSQLNGCPSTSTISHIQPHLKGIQLLQHY